MAVKPKPKPKKQPGTSDYTSPRRVTRAEWAKWENVGLKPDMDLDDLVLNWTDKRVTDLDAKGALVSLTMERTIEGASTVVMTLVDPNGRVFSERMGRMTTAPSASQAVAKRAYKRTPVEVDEGWNPILAPDSAGKAMEIELDGVTFRLVKVRYQHASEQLELTFEDRIVYWLKRKRGAKRADRANCTRAQFILSLLREIKTRDYRFVCPELTVKQPIDKAGKTGGGGSTGGGSTGSGKILLYVGDSLGVGTAPELEKKAPYKVSDYCEVGKSSAWAQDQFNAHYSASHFAVVFDAGTNDGNAPGPLISRLTAVKKKAGDRTVLVATMNGAAAGMNDELKAWAASTSGVELVDWQKISQTEGLVGGDGIHPTPAGYTRRAELFYAALPKPSTAAPAMVLHTGGVPVADRHGMFHSLLAASTGTVASAGEADTATASGLAPNAQVRVKGVVATAEQRSVGTKVLTAADKCNAPDKARLALVEACIVESTMRNLDGGDRDSRGVLQVRDSTAANIPGLNNRDPESCAREFLENGYWRHRPKGAMELAKTQSGWSAGKVAQETQGSAYPDRYDEVKGDAQGWLDAWKGGGVGGADASTSDDGSGGEWKTKRYQFARNADENSWQAMQRLSEEVAWRCFVVGNSVYYMSEEDLYARRPRYEVRPEDPSIIDLSYDVDWGKPVSEATLTVALDRWGAPPGSIIVLSGWGPPDGRWLIHSVSRDWFGTTADLTIRQPGKEKLEPANEREQRATKAAEGTNDSEGVAVDNDGSKGAQVYSAAYKIHEKQYPYTWGGGHARAGTADGGTGRDPGPGYDCSGSCCAALAAAGLGYRVGGPVDVSGTMAANWGKPGKGRQLTVWANGQHVWIEFHGMSKNRFDTSPQGDTSGRGPRLRSTARGTGGFTPRNWPGV